MKTYYEQKDGSLVTDNMRIPNDPENRHYKKAQQECEDGEAVIDPYVGSDRQTNDVAREQNNTQEDVVRQAKLTGVLFDGVFCSATKEDMWGLAAVEPWVRSGATTNFNFDNGNTLRLTPLNIDAFKAVWVPFRASFFP